MQPAITLKGYPASKGAFAGPVYRLIAPSGEARQGKDATAEREDFERSILQAKIELSHMVDAINGQGKDVLSIQLALLEDPNLLEHALEDIARGQRADLAWTNCMNSQIDAYEADEDEQFRARAADMKDLRQRVLRRLHGVQNESITPGSVVVGDDLAPSAFLEADWSHGGAIALSAGSPLSHVAMLARAKGVPMVVGLGSGALSPLKDAIVDGEQGLVHGNPSPETMRAFAVGDGPRAKAGTAPPASRARANGARPVLVMINVGGSGDVLQLDPDSCDGIGLVRTEFLFRQRNAWPDEDEQFEIYRSLATWAKGKPVTIRAFDAGGDKPLPGLSPAHEDNPFMGMRGIRLLLRHKEVFKTQLRAIARAAVYGDVSVMIPMVSSPAEIRQTRDLLTECAAELQASGHEFRLPQLGIMVETPVAAIAPQMFADAGFFSIGTNDLLQYLAAASRDRAELAHLQRDALPVAMTLIAGLTGFGKANGIAVSLCGDLASDTRHTRALLQAGLTCFSVEHSMLADVNAAIAEA